MTTMDDQLVPEFALAVRGYDRLQVDEYIAQLNGWIAEAEARQTWAESAVSERDQRMATLEARLAEVESDHSASSPAAMLDEAARRVEASLEAAAESAHEIKAQAHARAEVEVADAREQAKALVASSRAALAELETAAKADRAAAADALEDARRQAEEAAADIRTQAEADAAEILAAAERSRQAAQAEIDRLQVEHQRVVTQLAELRAALEGLIAAPAAVLAAVDELTNQDGAGR